MPTSVNSASRPSARSVTVSPTPHVRLVVEEVAGHDERVAVARDEEAALLELRAHRLRPVGQPEHDERAAGRVVGADALRVRERPRLRRHDARDLLRRADEDRRPGRRHEAHLDVVVEVVERLVDRPDEARPEREHAHEHRSAERERGEREDEPGLAPERVPDREQRRAGRAADRLQRAVEPAAPEAVADARRSRSASRTVTRTPRQTGHAAAASGTTSPIATSSARTLGGMKNSVASKLTRPAVNCVSAHAPSAPSGQRDREGEQRVARCTIPR